MDRDMPQIITSRSEIRRHLDEIRVMEKSTFGEPWSTAQIEFELDSESAFPVMLLENSVCAGYLFASGACGEIQLNKICIHAEMRKRGLGEKLLREFIDQARILSVEKIFLEVSTINIAAISLYRKCGFVVNRMRKGIYENGEDALEMVLVPQKSLRPNLP